MNIPKFAIAVLLCATSLAAPADVRLPRVLADHMVLQRDVPIHIWGWAAPDEQVTVSLEKDSQITTADAIGKWSVTLPARHAGGGPLKVTVAGKNTIVLSDILMGDVWLASGQSNMQLPMSGWSSAPMKDSASEIAAANIPDIRILNVNTAATVYPLTDLKDPKPWLVCTPESVASFSAAAYFFGREIHEHTKVPIGLIESSWGGTPAEAWISLDGMAAGGVLWPVMSAHATDMNQEGDLVQKWDVDATVAKAAGKPVPVHSGDRAVSWVPASIYNGMIAPLLNMPIKGVIWYQGESNAEHARSPYYEPVFETLITDWRNKWKSPDMPFIFVQIASFWGGNDWMLVRDAQRRALKLNKTGMAVAIDIGDEKNVHPANKQAVGHRLALQAEAQVYGEDVVKDGPLYKQATPMGDSIQVSFSSAVGLKTADSELGGFEVAGADGVFHPATATIRDDKVVAKSSDVAAPLSVRYLWIGFPKVASLYNAADLPASPFTSVDPVKK